jgi:hypothetical protein
MRNCSIASRRGRLFCDRVFTLICDDLLTYSKISRDNWENRKHSDDVICGDVKMH